MDNAEKYSDQSPRIEVLTENKSSGIKISIKDNGIGIPKEAQKHVFDKFYRVHTGNRHDVKGFGLGLSYVKSIAELYGWDVKLQSSTNEGSTFSIIITDKTETK